MRPDSRLGPYTVMRLLSMGGMSCTYLALWQPAGGADSQQIAIKVANTAADVPKGRDLPAEQLEAFYYEALSNEVEILKKLHHPNIVRLYPIPWGIKNDPYIARATNVGGAPWFYAMEYLEGGSVTQLMELHGALEPKLAVEIAYQVISALDYMHSKGYAHLDVKPDNVLLRRVCNVDATQHPEAVLIDFGIARRHQQSGPEAGSLPYMPPELVPMMTGAVAPEQVIGGPAVDVYASGVLLYQMLTGHLPFSGRTDVAITTAIVKTEPTKPSLYNHDVDGPLEGVILQTLQKDPAQRPLPQELLLLLDSTLTPRRFTPAVPDKVIPPPANHKSGKRWPRALIGAVILLAAASLALSLLWGPLSAQPVTPVPVASPSVTVAPEALAPLPTPLTVATPTASRVPTHTPRPAPTLQTPIPAALATSTPVDTRTPTATATQRPPATQTPVPTLTPTPELTQ